LRCAADSGSLYRLHIAKLTASLPAKEWLWIVRAGFHFAWHPDEAKTPQKRASEALDADKVKVLDLRTGRAKGAYYTLRELQGESLALGITQRAMPAIVARLKADGSIYDARLPKELCQGSRRTYLEVRAEAEEVLDTGQPVFPEKA
jgi:hypothetical protein